VLVDGHPNDPLTFMRAASYVRKNANRHGRDGAGIVPTIVDSEMTVKGNFTSGGELHVPARSTAMSRSKTLTVGKDAVIRGTVTAEQVRVCGEIIGCIRAREVTLAATARVVGGRPSRRAVDRGRRPARGALPAP